jgi:hypothetical protein
VARRVPVLREVGARKGVVARGGKRAQEWRQQLGFDEKNNKQKDETQVNQQQSKRKAHKFNKANY